MSSHCFCALGKFDQYIYGKRVKVPVVVQSDWGPQFMSREFQIFAKEWEFLHAVSLTYNSPLNGKAESAVKIFKESTVQDMALLE